MEKTYNYLRGRPLAAAAAVVATGLVGKIVYDQFQAPPAFKEGLNGTPRATVPKEKYPQLVEELREIFRTGKTKTYEWRVQQLQGMIELLKRHKEEFREALYKDLRRPTSEFVIVHTNLLSTIKHLLANLKALMAEESVATPAAMQPARCYVRRDPFGVVLVLSPFNFPVTLALTPLASALAAGNCAVLKPSELTPNCSALMARLLPRYLDNSAVAVVEGGVEEAQALTKAGNCSFDKIFYTGSGRVGSLIMKEAAESLTPVALELGGKTPVFVDDSADFDVAARRIAQGKFLNAGQICIAPDYVMVTPAAEKPFLDALTKTIQDFYGPDPQKSENYARIVNATHFGRLSKLLGDSGGNIVCGGQTDEKDRYIAPTVISRVKETAPIMHPHNEIFGPLLPVLSVKDEQAFVRFVNERPKPLAMYIFSSKHKTSEGILDKTTSGTACVYETIFQYCNPSLPFGGVGPSGMGFSHGKEGFDEFCHRRAVVRKSRFADVAIRYPPFTDCGLKFMEWLLSC